jgi:hypothetical protein
MQKKREIYLSDVACTKVYREDKTWNILGTYKIQIHGAGIIKVLDSRLS